MLCPDSGESTLASGGRAALTYAGAAAASTTTGIRPHWPLPFCYGATCTFLPGSAISGRLAPVGGTAGKDKAGTCKKTREAQAGQKLPKLLCFHLPPLLSSVD